MQKIIEPNASRPRNDTCADLRHQTCWLQAYNPLRVEDAIDKITTTVKMSSSNRGSMFGPDGVAQLAATQMEKYGMTPSPSKPRHSSEALISSDRVDVSVPLTVQIEEDRQIMATLATRLINANRTIELLNAVVDAKDESVEELATECGQNRKDLARSSGQASALAAELAEVQSELTLVTSRDSKVSRDSA